MITLVLGGARSGKSAIAERLAAAAGAPVTYIATMRADPADADLGERIRRHRLRRPASWTTREAGPPPATDLTVLLRDTAGTVLLDALGSYLAAHPNFDIDVAAICAALRGRRGDTVLVSDEVGMGVHPETDVGRTFRDALGEANQAVAAVADRVLLAVAGRVLPLAPWDGLPPC